MLSLLILVFLLGCLGLNTRIATPTPSQALPTPFIVTSTATASSVLTETPVPSITPSPAPAVRRVLIVSIDGLRPDIISLAPMPNLLALMQSGSYSLSAQTVRPSVTLVSHASMLVGVCPAKHGVDWNDYIPERGYAIGTDLFDIAKAVGLETHMYVTKRKLVQITEPASLDRFVFVNDRDTALAERLASEFPQNFGVLFVHLGLVDGMGHAHGWLSPEQLSVAFRADEALGRILTELDARGLRNETLVIVSADHGGHGTTHGSTMPEDMTIPWIAAGPGIQPRALTSPVHTMDTAATAAFALGLPLPPEWDGVPVYEAFGLPVERQSLQCP
ncbi:MAG TPA: alkaline phosphatase family protein [Anaerolineales bacterium]|nr:alkaline phosphatase family protein [Anaerolineales bacterium]